MVAAKANSGWLIVRLQGTWAKVSSLLRVCISRCNMGAEWADREKSVVMEYAGSRRAFAWERCLVNASGVDRAVCAIAFIRTRPAVRVTCGLTILPDRRGAP